MKEGNKENKVKIKVSFKKEHQGQVDASRMSGVEASLSAFHFVPLSVSSTLSQSLQEEEEEEVARGTKGRARATAPTPQQPPPHREWEASEPSTPSLPHLPPFMLLLLYAVTPPSVFISQITMIEIIGAGHSSLQICLPFFFPRWFLRQEKLSHQVL